MITIIRDKKVAVVELHGALRLNDLKVAIRELLAHPDHVDGMDELWDFQHASVVSFQASDLSSLAQFASPLLPKLGKRTALVVAHDVDYGIGRMWEVYAAEPAPQERRLFRSRDKAWEWLVPTR